MNVPVINEANKGSLLKSLSDEENLDYVPVQAPGDAVILPVQAFTTKCLANFSSATRWRCVTRNMPRSDFWDGSYPSFRNIRRQPASGSFPGGYDGVLGWLIWIVGHHVLREHAEAIGDLIGQNTATYGRLQLEFGRKHSGNE